MTTYVTMQMQESSDTNVDAITATGRSLDERNRVRGMAFTLMGERTASRNEMQPFQRHGFKGVTYKGVTFAERQDCWMISVMGYVPLSFLRDLAKSPGLRVSRLDVAYTTRLRKPKPNFASQLYDLCKDGIQVGGQRVPTSIIQGLEGDTLYMGKRSSRTFIRIYDKSAPLFEENGTVWRFEVEFKKERASMVWDALAGADFDISAQRYIITNVLAAREVYLDVEAVKAVRLSELLTEVSNGQERRLNWVKSTVIPAIKASYRQGEGDGLELLFKQEGFSLSQEVK